MSKCVFATEIDARPAGMVDSIGTRFKVGSAGRRRRIALSALAALAASAVAAPAEALSTQLSVGMPFSDIDFASTRPQVSPDGQWAVYRHDAVVDNAAWLWSVPMAGGDPIQLSENFAAGAFLTFAISADSQYVVYSVDQSTPGKTELYSVAIDGSGPIKKISGTITANRNVSSFVISPTSDYVVYAADRGATDNEFNIYSVPIEGPGSLSVPLNHDLPSDWDVEAYRISPDGETVVYRPVRTALGFGELWSVPIIGGEAVKINRFLDIGCAVDSDFQISPNSATVIYRADAPTDETYELYTVPIYGGTSIKLNPTLPGGASVQTGFQISPNNSKVVFRADTTAVQTFNLYSAPLGGGTATKLNGPLGNGEDVAVGFQITSDNSKVVYRSDEDTTDIDELYVVPIGGGTPLRLNGTMISAGDVLDFAVSPDGSRVVYRADQSVDTLNELYSVAISGGTVTKLNRTLAAGGDVQQYRISPDSAWVVYGADQDIDTVDELLGVAITGGTVQDMSGPLVNGGDVVLNTPTQGIAFDIAPGVLRAMYAADEDFNDEVALYTASLAGPPGAPTAVVALPGNTQATVTFVPPTNNGGSGIIGFTVTSNPPGGIDSNAGSTALTHVVTNLVNGTPYTFTVTATNIHGTSEASQPSTPVIPATLPGAPTGVVATPRNQSADVSFTPPTNNGGSPILGYSVVSLPPGGVDINAGSLSLTHYVQGLTNLSSYTFTVVAINAIGTSPLSTPSNLISPECIPGLVNLFCDGLESEDTLAWDLTLPGPPFDPNSRH
jgi:hypothetical protein